MKLLLTALALCAFSFTSFAQNNNTTSDQPDERILFQSKVRQLVSYLAEGNERAAGILFKDVATQMDTFIKQTRDSVKNASSSDKRKLKEKLNRQQQLMAQFQSYKSNLIRNKESINTWSDQFIKTLY